MRKTMLCTAVLAISGLSPALTVEAGGKNRGNAGVLPPNSNAFGKSYGEWTAAWWQWIFSLPADRNPLFNEDFACTTENQTEKVFFLAGTLGSSGDVPTVRTCTVSAGTALFFPVANLVAWRSEDPVVGDDVPKFRSCFAPDVEDDETVLRMGVNSVMDAAVSLELTIDGQPRQPVRAESPAVSLPGALFESFGAEDGEIQLAVSDGYWVLLAPLSVGEHTIQFDTEINNQRETDCLYHFRQNVIYHITVVGGKKK